MKMQKKSLHHYYYYYSCLLFLSLNLIIIGHGESSINITVGVILDLNSSVGGMAENCISMGLMDFYNHNPHYATRLSLQLRDSHNDLVTAASAAQDLIENEKVEAIIGPQNSKEASFVIELGSKSSVPIISFSPTSVSLSPSQTNQNDCSQFKAISSIIESNGWLQIIPIYEDTQYASSVFIPCLLDALQEINTHMPYRSAIGVNSEVDEIVKELNKIKGMQTQVFLVHITNDTFGSNFFQLVDKQGMMKEGYAWIVSQPNPTIIELDPMAPKLRDLMQGVLGVRPLVNNTTELVDFKRRWELLAKSNSNITSLTLFGLWAYDTVQVLATAIEKASIGNSTVDLANTISNITLRGLSGNFSLKKEGQEGPSIFEVFNVIRQTERIVGYWSPQRGLFRNFGEASGEHKLKGPIIWPGDTEEKPVPKLRIGVVVRSEGNFSEKFVKVIRRESSIQVSGGFAIDLFKEVVNFLPFAISYEFDPLTNNGSYDDIGELLCQIIEEKKVDAIVGDMTILANRTKCVDFTLPYIASSVSMVVRRKENLKSVDLLKPFDSVLWIILACILVAAIVVIILLEVGKHNEKEEKIKVLKELISFPLSVFSRDDDWKSNLSKWVAFIFSIFFIMVVQIYTASLTSMLTEKAVKPEPSLKDIEEIKLQDYSVGYQKDSWVQHFLIKELELKKYQLKAYGSPEEYNQALTLGTEKGGVDAIFDETPYLTTFLSIKRFDNYTMVGEKYPTAGFGFAFPRKSGLVSYFSDAILKVIEDRETFERLEKKNSLNISSEDESSDDSDFRSLSKNDFINFFWLVLVIIGVFFVVGVLRVLKINLPRLLCAKFSSSSSSPCVSKEASA